MIEVFVGKTGLQVCRKAGGKHMAHVRPHQDLNQGAFHIRETPGPRALLFLLQDSDNVEDDSGDNTGDNTGVPGLWVSGIGAQSSAGAGDFIAPQGFSVLNREFNTFELCGRPTSLARMRPTWFPFCCHPKGCAAPN